MQQCARAHLPPHLPHGPLPSPPQCSVAPQDPQTPPATGLCCHPASRLTPLATLHMGPDELALPAHSPPHSLPLGPSVVPMGFWVKHKPQAWLSWVLQHLLPPVLSSTVVLPSPAPMPPSHNWLLSLLGALASALLLETPHTLPRLCSPGSPTPAPGLRSLPFQVDSALSQTRCSPQVHCQVPQSSLVLPCRAGQGEGPEGDLPEAPHLGMLTWPRSPGPHPSQPVSTCPTSPGSRGRPSSQLPRPGTQLAPLHRCGWGGGGTDQGAPREAWPLPAQPLARAGGSLRPVPSQPSRPRPQPSKNHRENACLCQLCRKQNSLWFVTQIFCLFFRT